MESVTMDPVFLWQRRNTHLTFVLAVCQTSSRVRRAFTQEGICGIRGERMALCDTEARNKARTKIKMYVPKLREQPREAARKPGLHSTLLGPGSAGTLESPGPHDEAQRQGHRQAFIFHDRNRHNT